MTGLPALMASDEQLPLNPLPIILNLQQRFDEERKELQQRFDEERKELLQRFVDAIREEREARKSVLDITLRSLQGNKHSQWNNTLKGMIYVLTAPCILKYGR